MTRHAKASSAGPTQRLASRLGLVLLTAIFLLVPAAQAAANGHFFLNIEGSGSGEVSSVGGYFGTGRFEGSPPIECSYASPGPATGVCDDEMLVDPEEGFEGVFLTATPAPGSEIVGWTVEKGVLLAECGAGAEFCWVAEFAEGEAEVTAEFAVAVPRFPLTLKKEGSGQGNVTSDKGFPPLNCGSSCSEQTTEAKEGETVTLTASAPFGEQFDGWGSGECDSEPQPNKCVVTITAAKEVHATFNPIPRTLTINETGSGSGAVECEINGGGLEACAGPYPNGATVKVVATADPGSELTSLTGTASASSCSTSPCTFTINADSSVTATFDLARALTINEAGSGSGAVECEIDGGGLEACAGPYPNGATVKVVASADPGSELTSLSGANSAAACSASPCEFTITEDSSVTVTFDLEPGEVLLETHTAGTGSGEIKCNGGVCAASYPEGTTVTLEALPTGGHSTFSGWTVTGSGSVTTPCTGVTSPCEVKLEAPGPVSATATFAAITHTLNVTIVGAGTLECKDEGAGSFSACAPSYNEGHVVKLKETPGAHFSFTGWSAFAGSGSVTTPCAGAITECEVKIDANVTGTATWTQITHTLTVTKVGAGTLECKDEGAGSFSACAPSYNEGHVVKLKETPGAHFSFSGWSAFAGSGSVTTPCAGAITECEVKMDANVSGTATWSQITHTLTLTKVGAGTLECKDEGAGSFSACAPSYNEGHVVKLKETPGAHFSFTGWSAFAGSGSVTTPCAGAITECEVKIDANVSGTATWTQITHTLTITKAGAGSGSITCNATACAATYNEGATVTLAATAASGSTFTGWSGGGCSGTGNCVVTMGANTTVTATFDVQSSGGGGSTPPSSPSPAPASTPEKCVVPKLAGKTLGQARSGLSAAHCALGKVTKPKAKKGKKLGPLVVKSSSPGAGASLPAGGKVNLKLGPKPKHKHKK